MSKTTLYGSLIYAALVVGVSIWHFCAAPASPKTDEPRKRLAAVKAFPVNYLLRDDDLEGDGKKADLSGKYTARAVAQGEAIDDDAVSDDPKIDDANSGLLRLGISSIAVKVGRGNAASDIIICRGEEKLGPAKVVAQMCDDSDPNGCHVLVKPSDQGALVSLVGLRAAADTCALAPAAGADAAK